MFYSSQATSALCFCCAKALGGLSLEANDGKLVTVCYGVCPLLFWVLSGALVAQNGPFMVDPLNRTHLDITFLECPPDQCHWGELHFQSCSHRSNGRCGELCHMDSVGFPWGGRKRRRGSYLILWSQLFFQKFQWVGEVCSGWVSLPSVIRLPDYSNI